MIIPYYQLSNMVKLNLNIFKMCLYYWSAIRSFFSNFLFLNRILLQSFYIENRDWKQKQHRVYISLTHMSQKHNNTTIKPLPRLTLSLPWNLEQIIHTSRLSLSLSYISSTLVSFLLMIFWESSPNSFALISLWKKNQNRRKKETMKIVPSLFLLLLVSASSLSFDSCAYLL